MATEALDGHGEMTPVDYRWLVETSIWRGDSARMGLIPSIITAGARPKLWGYVVVKSSNREM